MNISDNERKVIEMLMAEKTYKEIQGEMKIGQGQLQFALRRLRRRFGAKNSIGLVVKYLKSA